MRPGSLSPVTEAAYLQIEFETPAIKDSARIYVRVILHIED